MPVQSRDRNADQVGYALGLVFLDRQCAEARVLGGGVVDEAYGRYVGLDDVNLLQWRDNE
jgi:hypothetical protein